MINIPFKVNDYISLILKDGRVNIVVEGKQFMTCKGVAIRIPIMDLQDIQESFSIDDLVSKYYKIVEEETDNGDEITLETDFLVHCISKIK